jgi:hypothetical protein
MPKRYPVGVRSDDLDRAREALENVGIPTLWAYEGFMGGQHATAVLAAAPVAESEPEAVALVKEALDGLGDVATDLQQVAVTVWRRLRSD